MEPLVMIGLSILSLVLSTTNFIMHLVSMRRKADDTNTPPPTPQKARKQPSEKRKPLIVDDYRAIQLEREHVRARKPLL